VTPADKVRYASVSLAMIPNFQREKILPVAATATGEVIQILGDTRVNVGLQMATETLRPLKFGKITNPENLLKSGGVTTIEPQVYVNDMLAYDTWWEKHKEMPVMRDVSFIVDFGAIRNAYIAMDVEGNEGATVDVAWGQTLIDGQVKPIVYSRGDRDAAGKAEHQFALRWNLRGGRQQLEARTTKVSVICKVTVRDLTEPLKIHEIAAIHSFAPDGAAREVRLLGSVPDRALRRQPAHPASRQLLHLHGQHDPGEKYLGGDITDGSVPCALAGYGDDPMTRNYIDLFARSQHPNGELTLIAGSEMPSEGMALMMHPMRTAIWMARIRAMDRRPGRCAGANRSLASQIPRLLEAEQRHRSCDRRRKGKRPDGTNMDRLVVETAGRRISSPARTACSCHGTCSTSGSLKTLQCCSHQPEAAACRAEAETITDWVFANCWMNSPGSTSTDFPWANRSRLSPSTPTSLRWPAGLCRDGRAGRIVQR